MDDIFFIIAKTTSFITRPSNIIFLSLFILFFFLKKSKLIFKLIYIFILLFLVAPFGLLIINQLEKRVPIPSQIPNNLNYIIVLGGFEELNLTSDRNQLNLNGSSERIIFATKLANNLKESKIVFVGGSGHFKKNKKDFKNTDVVKDYFKSINFNLNRVIFIPGSRNTYENIRDLKNNINLSSKDVIITSAFHMPRVLGLLNKNEISLIPFPVDYKTTKNVIDQNLFTINFFQTFSVSQNLHWLDFAVRECLALIIYRVTGKTDSFFP